MTDIEQFNELYEGAFPLDVLKNKTSEEYLAFSTKRGKPVKFVAFPELLDIIPVVQEYFKYFRDNPYSYLIPCDNYDGTTYGYVMRSVTGKEYRSVFNPGIEIQPTFGWYDFKDFKKGTPIVLTEGVKDCLAIKRYYPHCLALLSCKTSNQIGELLSKVFTKKVLIGFDNDYDKEKNAGSIAFKAAAKALAEHGINCHKLEVPYYNGEPLKDFGQTFSHPGSTIALRMTLKQIELV